MTHNKKKFKEGKFSSLKKHSDGSDDCNRILLLLLLTCYDFSLCKKR